MIVEGGSQTMAELSYFCKNCILYLQQLSEEIQQMTRTLKKAKDQSFEAFRESARQRCFICSKIWNLTEKHRIAWLNFQQAQWTPMLYSAEVGKEESWIRLTIIYHDPTLGATSDIRFRLINTNGISSIQDITAHSTKLILLRQKIQAAESIQRYTAKHILT